MFQKLVLDTELTMLDTNAEAIAAPTAAVAATDCAATRASSPMQNSRPSSLYPLLQVSQFDVLQPSQLTRLQLQVLYSRVE